MYGRLLLAALLLAGCSLAGVPGDLLLAERPTPTQPAVGVVDVSEVMGGICFEAAFDAAGQVFVLRSAAEHIRFYDLADNSHLCRHPVERLPFEFSEGRILAGLWNKGVGCTAHHDIDRIERDDASRQVTITAHFSIEGDCAYELVRPFWLALDRVADYKIDIRIIDTHAPDKQGE
jgi:hypothetical protein